MDLTQHVAHLRQQLAVAAEAGGEDARALAERLTAPLESATRLTLLNALSAATEEITRELAPGSVDVRLRGLEPEFVVTPPLAHEPQTDPAGPDGADGAEPSLPAPPPAAPEGDEGGTARINFRLPAHLKSRVEEAASQEGLSVNTWLVRAVSASIHGAAGSRGRVGAARPRPRGGQGYTGWVR